MTVNGIAKEYGVSRQSVYARVKKAGLQIDKLTDSNGQLSTEGVNAIRDLLNGQPVRPVNKDDADNGQLTDNAVLLDRIKDLQQQVAQLEERARIAEAAAARVPDLEHHCRYLEEQLAESITSTKEVVKLLPAGRDRNGPPTGPTFLQRLKDLFSRGDSVDPVNQNDDADEMPVE